MKTAISVPDATFHRATEHAAHLGMSRSEFFSRAAQRYLDDLDASSITDEINVALAMSGEDDAGAAAVEAGRRRLAADDEDW